MRPACGRDLAHQRDAGAEYGGAFELRFDAIGIDHPAGIHRDVNARNPDLAACIHFHFDDGGDVGQKAAMRGNAQRASGAGFLVRPAGFLARPIRSHCAAARYRRGTWDCWRAVLHAFLAKSMTRGWPIMSSRYSTRSRFAAAASSSVNDCTAKA